MKLLAIETSTEYCTVALAVGKQCLTRGGHEPRRHAELLLPWVSELLAEAGLPFGDLDALVFSRGPGSFTSLRIGIGVVQGLAWGADIPVVPLSSLQVTAQASAVHGVSSALVALDARMGEVFCGRYQCEDPGPMRSAGVELVCTPEVAADLAAPGWSGVGNGFGRYPALLAARQDLDSVHEDIWPLAEVMIPLAHDWLNRNEPLPAEQAQPVYLRDKVAEKPVQG